jgi:RNA polymerase sigma factor (TIGR02999 family)
MEAAARMNGSDKPVAPMENMDRNNSGVDDPTKTVSALLPAIYDELRRLAARKLARERPGHTLQPTALVHEAWLRLQESPGQQWASPAEYFGAAAEAMRRILVENARRKSAQKRGGGMATNLPDITELAAPMPDGQLLALDEALEAFAREDPVAADLVKLRFFVGVSHQEAAEMLGLNRTAADRAWVYARAWLAERMQLE